MDIILAQLGLKGAPTQLLFVQENEKCKMLFNLQKILTLTITQKRKLGNILSEKDLFLHHNILDQIAAVKEWNCVVHMCGT